MDELSQRQTAILEFISRHCRDSGYPPTVREIGLGVGLASPSTVHAHLAKLEAGGHIKRDPTKPRAMFLRREPEAEAAPAPVPTRRPVEALPLVGSVAAGAPRLAEQDVEDWVSTPFTGDFVLRVTGDSMTGAGILDGDLVVVRRAQTADDGEIVVAQIEDEATVKRLRRSGGRVELMPENDAYAPIVADEVLVLGVVVGVMRSL
jgi:repressor LexA